MPRIADRFINRWTVDEKNYTGDPREPLRHLLSLDSVTFAYKLNTPYPYYTAIVSPLHMPTSPAVARSRIHRDFFASVALHEIGVSLIENIQYALDTYKLYREVGTLQRYSLLLYAHIHNMFLRLVAVKSLLASPILRAIYMDTIDPYLAKINTYPTTQPYDELVGIYQFMYSGLRRIGSEEAEYFSPQRLRRVRVVDMVYIDLADPLEMKPRSRFAEKFKGRERKPILKHYLTEAPAFPPVKTPIHPSEVENTPDIPIFTTVRARESLDRFIEEGEETPREIRALGYSSIEEFLRKVADEVVHEVERWIEKNREFFSKENIPKYDSELVRALNLIDITLSICRDQKERSSVPAILASSIPVAIECRKDYVEDLLMDDEQIYERAVRDLWRRAEAIESRVASLEPRYEEWRRMYVGYRAGELEREIKSFKKRRRRARRRRIVKRLGEVLLLGALAGVLVLLYVAMLNYLGYIDLG